MIEKEVFSNTSIKSFWIPPHVTEIGERSFSQCKKLKHVVFTENSELTILGNYAFSFCGIERISLPAHLTKLSVGVFSCCSNLRKVDIPKDSELNTIEYDAFSNTSITSFYIPKHVQIIGEGCFDGCNLQIIEIDPENELLSDQNIRNDAIIMAPHKLINKYFFYK